MTTHTQELAERPAATAAQPLDRLINIKEVQRLIGMGPSSIYNWIREGKLPAPVKLSQRCTRWKLSSIQQFISEQGKPQ